jgi:hypothetical protein
MFFVGLSNGTQDIGPRTQRVTDLMRQVVRLRIKKERKHSKNVEIIEGGWEE